MDALDNALMISGIASPPPPQKLIDFTSPPLVKPTPRDEEPRPLLKIVRKQSPPPPILMQKPPIKKPPMIVPEIVKKPAEPPKREATPPKKKEPEPSDDEYFDEDAEKEKDRLRKLRNMNRRAHRGFSQAEIMMMRWEFAPKTYPEGQTEYDWDCKICKRLISGAVGN
jgi:hypothetical protein